MTCPVSQEQPSLATAPQPLVSQSLIGQDELPAGAARTLGRDVLELRVRRESLSLDVPIGRIEDERLVGADLVAPLIVVHHLSAHGAAIFVADDDDVAARLHIPRPPIMRAFPV